MKPQTTPSFSFERNGSTITCWFNNHPIKTQEGKERYMSFERTCSSELEASLLLDYLRDFEYLIHKEYFTRGYDAHKKREKNYYR